MILRKRDKRWCRCCVGCIVFMVMFGLLFFGYYCPNRICAMTQGSPTAYQNKLDAYLQGDIIHENFRSEDIHRDYEVDFDGEDVLVFLHMQKTGGSTFGRHLVKNLARSTAPCRCTKGRKRCECRNSDHHIWLFSRFSVGWPCGLHADWTELHACVHQEMNRLEKKDRRRRYFRYMYMTVLRDPVERYLSEWKHVQRGATWKAAGLRCNGRQATLQEVPFCFEGEHWKGVSLKKFMNCPYNLANNRQTRMLANLSLVGCYNQSLMPAEKRNQVLLQSAKDNLKSMAYFGLTEYQHETQYLFERTFNLKFRDDFKQLESTRARSVNLTEHEKSEVLRHNELDIQVYQFAKALFFQRYHKARAEEAQEVKNGTFSDQPVNIQFPQDHSVIGSYDKTHSYEDDFDYKVS